jgi:hypothetical protein
MGAILQEPSMVMNQRYELMFYKQILRAKAPLIDQSLLLFRIPEPGRCVFAHTEQDTYTGRPVV